ncbi:MAG: hypothetical protein ABJB01_05040 [Rudaea sp.]
MTSIFSGTPRGVAATLLAALLSNAAFGAVIFPKVTNINNSGSGSLRAAITAANANGADGAIISFDIGSGCGPHVIHLDTALPDITAETHIEGYTQPGASKNTIGHYQGNDAVICIVLAGDNLVDDGLSVPSTVGNALEMSVQGIAFSGFTHSAVNLRGGSHHVVGGIRTGGTMGGVALETNSYGVILAAGVHDSTVGGADNSDVDQFGDITHNAVYIASSNATDAAAHNNIIENVNVGFVYNAAQARVTLPTGGAGIAIGGYGNFLYQIDVENAGAAGVHISNTDAHDNSLYLGAADNNSGDGILIDDDAHTNDITQVALYSNAGAGIRVVNGQGNDIEYNIMLGNKGLGIDLAGEGVTPNDNDSMQPAPDYANRGQNFPTLTTAAGGHYSANVSGTLTTTPGVYQIGIYETAGCTSGLGQGENELAFRNGATGLITVPNLTVQGQGSVAFSIPVSFYSYSSGQRSVIATATDANGNTSEFSACIPYVDDTIFFDNFEGSPT